MQLVVQLQEHGVQSECVQPRIDPSYKGWDMTGHFMDVRPHVGETQGT